MSKDNPILTLRIDTKNPIEISEFVGAFTSLAEEYRRTLSAEFPDIDPDAKIYVKEVRKGSYEADLIPYMALAAPFIAQMDQVMIVEQFVRTWGSRLKSLIDAELGDWKPNKSELATWTNATAAIATDPNASSTLEMATFEDGERNIRAAFKFTTTEAKSAQRTIDSVYREIEAPSDADHKRVLMVFTRSDIGNAKVGKRSGERVVIESLSTRSLALMYASELSEQRIKHEIRETEDNVYKKGFVVDVNVKMVRGKPSAYAVTHVHSIIDLPDDDE